MKSIVVLMIATALTLIVFIIYSILLVAFSIIAAFCATILGLILFVENVFDFMKVGFKKVRKKL